MSVQYSVLQFLQNKSYEHLSYGMICYFQLGFTILEKLIKVLSVTELIRYKMLILTLAKVECELDPTES
jgi:hypothetical protein